MNSQKKHSKSLTFMWQTLDYAFQPVTQVGYIM